MKTDRVAMAKEIDPVALTKISSFCVYPFIELSTVPAGFLRPCCFFTHMIKDEKHELMNVQRNTFQEAWNSPHLRSVRQEMLAGKAQPGCEQCYNEERYGSQSMRQRSFWPWLNRPEVRDAIQSASENEGYVKGPVRFLELKPGNLCNLKCRMCNQFDSSSVAAELASISKKFSELQLGNKARLFDDANFEPDFNASKMADWQNNPALWESARKIIPELEVLSIAGGEPTLIPEVFDFLSECVSSGRSSHIQVFFSSNFTRIPEKLVELSKHFREFNFIASIDGVGPVQEYIRFPSKWEDVSRNYLRILEQVNFKNTRLSVNMTLNIYNILHFTEFLAWLESQPKNVSSALFDVYPMNINILEHPPYLKAQNLPAAVRGEAIRRIEEFRGRTKIFRMLAGLDDRIKQVLEMLKEDPESQPGHARRVEQFWKFTRILDESRGQSLAATLPELHAAMLAELARLGIDADESPVQRK